MATRRTLDDDTYRGGRVNADDDAPRHRRYPCFATGCPMPGTIWPGVTQGAGDQPGSCAWHYGVQPLNIPRVTQVLKDWGSVAYEVDECRRVHTSSETACSPKAQDAAFRIAVERLRPHVQAGGWGDEFEARPGERYAGWGSRLEAFLGARVVEVLSVHARRAA